MPSKKQIKLGEKVPLKLTAGEPKLVLEDLTCLDPDYEKIIRDTPGGKPVMMTLDDLDDFGGYIAIFWSRLDRIYYAATCDDAAAAGFDNRSFYREIKKPTAERAIPMQQALREEALVALQAWVKKEDRHPY